jgi:hypothetical protein
MVIMIMVLVPWNIILAYNELTCVAVNGKVGSVLKRTPAPQISLRSVLSCGKRMVVVESY